MRYLRVVVAVAILFCSCAKLAVAQAAGTLTVARLYAGADGVSHIEQINLKLSSVPGAPAGLQESEPVSMKNAYVVRVGPGYFEGWHNADERRYIATISGRAEVEVTGGQKLVLQPGQLALAEDLTGKGHTFRVVGDSEWVALFVNMEK